MEKKEQKKLVNELKVKLKLTKHLEENIKNDGFMPYEVCKHEVTYNPKYLSKEEIYQLLSLKKFIEDDGSLTEEDIRTAFTSNKKDFAFLIECDGKYKNFINLVQNQLGFLMNKIAYDRRSDEVFKRELP